MGHISCIIRDILEVMSKGIGYKRLNLASSCITGYHLSGQFTSPENQTTHVNHSYHHLKGSELLLKKWLASNYDNGIIR